MDFFTKTHFLFHHLEENKKNATEAIYKSFKKFAWQELIFQGQMIWTFGKSSLSLMKTVELAA